MNGAWSTCQHSPFHGTQEYIDKARSMEKQRPKGIVLGKRGEEALSFGGGVSRAARAQMTSGKELLDMGLTRL